MTNVSELLRAPPTGQRVSVIDEGNRLVSYYHVEDGSPVDGEHHVLTPVPQGLFHPVWDAAWDVGANTWTGNQVWVESPETAALEAAIQQEAGVEDQRRQQALGMGLPVHYDAVRDKWLGELQEIQYGRNGTTPSGSYFKGINGLTFSASLGYIYPYDVVIVGATVNNANNISGDIVVTANGSVGAALPIAGSSAAADDLDATVTAGSVIAVSNNTGSTMDKTQGIVLLRRLIA